jgi:hypothetical protein
MFPFWNVFEMLLDTGFDTSVDLCAFCWRFWFLWYSMNAWIICGENSPAAEGDFPQQDRAESQSEACHQYASNTPHPKFFLVAPTGDI